MPPLPPAPTRRAAQLPPEAFKPSARKAHATQKSAPDEAVLDPVLATNAVATPPATVASAASRKGSRRNKGLAPAAATVSTTANTTPHSTASATSTASGTRRSVQTPALVQAPVVAAAVAPLAVAAQPTPASTVATAVAVAPVSVVNAPAAVVAEATRTTKARQRNRGGRKAIQGTGLTKLFVLDTNVLLHDPTSLFRFEEHDIYLPMIVLEELDAHKKGMTEVARNGRQVSRWLDALAATQGADFSEGLQLNATGQRAATGNLYFQTSALDYQLPTSLPQGKADNQILGVVESLRKLYAPREVVLVSKDINMRVKARALGLPAEDYQNDKALDDGELLYSGALPLPADFWNRHGKAVESWQNGPNTFYRITGPIVAQLMVNQFVYFEAPGEPSLYARVTEIRDKTAVLRTLKDYANAKNAVWGVSSRNREQNFALNLLMDPEVDLVTLTGTAGTGKTLMALAAGLMQVLDERRYTEIIMTRATVSVGDDIGFLPGTEEEKMGPWMGALDDNLEFLAKGEGGNPGEWGRAATNELIRSRIKIKSMNFMRGRTFMNKYVIIDEAQNLTPKQMKTLITRAGPGTKIICMGNLAQIDTPYLTEGSSGLTFTVDRFKGWPHSGHITLARGERSRLADFASDVL